MIASTTITCGRRQFVSDDCHNWQMLFAAIVYQAAKDARRRQSYLSGPALAWLHSAEAQLVAEAAGLELPEVRR